MAVGDGGFKQVPFGFDKNEVNTYIADLRKKTKAMEEEVKANNKKTEEALKLAEEADARIQEAVKAGEDKAAEITRQLEAEQRKSADLEEKLKKLNEDLEKERKNMSEMLMSGKGVNAEAKKVYTEIIDKANADAKAIIDNAQAKAQEITAAADARRSDTDAKTTEFLAVMKAQIEAFGENYKTVAESAAELLGSSAVAAPVVEMPTMTAAPVAPVAAPAPVKEEEPTLESMMAAVEAQADAVEEEIVTEIKAEQSVYNVTSDADAMPGIDEISAASAGDAPASFDDVWGGNELAQTIFNDEKKDAVPLVNPDAMNMFGKDLFGLGEAAEEEELTGDLVAEEQPKEEEEQINEVKPLDVSDVADVAFDSSFDQDLLSQTMPSGSLGDVGNELLEAVKAAEASFAVQPTQPEVDDLDMDEEPAATFGGDTEDDLMKALREAEAALNSLAPAGTDMSEEA
ncbi:MAG: hypothetical protein J6A16_12130, partial [Oscillospiraceae bacterium]|nr:hypothetical protein [Oscillospiraceae bacterium]